VDAEAAARLSRWRDEGGGGGSEAKEASELWEELVLLRPRSIEFWRLNLVLGTEPTVKISYLLYVLYAGIHKICINPN
jgi:hypothetical protein